MSEQHLPSSTAKIRTQLPSGEYRGVFVTVAGTPERGVVWIFSNSGELSLQNQLISVDIQLSASFRGTPGKVPEVLHDLLELWDISGGYIIEGTDEKVPSLVAHMVRVVWNACLDLEIAKGERLSI